MKKPILAIRTVGDPCLREVSQPLQGVGPSERILIQAMFETMYHADGVGLAAPQVGINKQIIVLDVGKGPLVMVNPDIVQKEGESVMEEGCLSVPGRCVKIQRAETITVRFLDEQGDSQELMCSGLLSCAVQHECDHLQGKLIVDYDYAKENRQTDQTSSEVQL
jgi:peptide deformylase